MNSSGGGVGTRTVLVACIAVLLVILAMLVAYWVVKERDRRIDAVVSEVKTNERSLTAENEKLQLQLAEAQKAAKDAEERQRETIRKATAAEGSLLEETMTQSAVASRSTVYYVVVGSFESLSKAQEYNVNGPADMECGTIYKAHSKGKTLYRICTGCYTSKAEARQAVAESRDFWMEWRGVTPWVWTNKGYADSVE